MWNNENIKSQNEQEQQNNEQTNEQFNNEQTNTDTTNADTNDNWWTENNNDNNDNTNDTNNWENNDANNELANNKNYTNNEENNNDNDKKWNIWKDDIKVSIIDEELDKYIDKLETKWDIELFIDLIAKWMKWQNAINIVENIKSKANNKKQNNDTWTEKQAKKESYSSDSELFNDVSKDFMKEL